MGSSSFVIDVVVVVVALTLGILVPFSGGKAAASPSNNKNNNDNNRGGAARVQARCLSFQDTMDSCLGPLGGTLGLRPGDQQELLSDLNATKALCQEGKLQDAMTCLEEVFNDCAAASRAYRYRQQQQRQQQQQQPPSSLNLVMANGNWRNSMERLCANVDYLQQHEQCTRVIAVESSHCIQRESQSFMNKSSQVLAKALRRGRTGHKQLMDLGCRFAHSVIMCFQFSLDKEPSCPCRYRHLIVDIVMNSMPPFCKPDIDYYYYVYNECLDKEMAGVIDDDEDDAVDVLDDVDGGAGGLAGYSSGAEASNPRYGSGSSRQGSSRQGGSGAVQKGVSVGGSPGEVVIVQKPQLVDMKGKGGAAGAGGDEGVYEVNDVGQSQGHRSGTGSKVGAGPGQGVAAVQLAAGLAALWLVVVEVLLLR